MLIWFWLAGLMLLGVVLTEFALVPLPSTGMMALVAVLSTVKALLVALYYMHLKADSRLLTLIVLVPLAIVALALTVVLSSRFVRL
jgi:caa(3)-type oxidase subunit IV